MILSFSGKIGSGKDTSGKIAQILIDNPHFVNNAVKDFLKREIIKPSFTIEKWGGALKDITCLLIGCTREELEDETFKNKELGEEWERYLVLHVLDDTLIKMYTDVRTAQEYVLNIHSKILRDEGKKREILKTKKSSLTPRLLLQYLGTECGRNIIHPNIWINALMSKYVDKHTLSTWGHETLYPNWIITDTRFPNELKAVTDKDGINIRINRIFNTPVVNLDGITVTTVRKGSLEKEHESETALDNATFDYTIENDSTLDELIDKIREVLITLKLI